ncbi:hypothetical protein, conserved [Trypanosoma brucei brucei TREU927]|uniref:RWD domain-containing protein n=1 Tax=Trypanosoma brucei brucei (strain 927/4 GUTat10.1) TaxID=185431 RepID=Q383I1_TRYB2|nr:hypothetical protein, conserved [Trypanosoma brucei brucei TREU927]EAN80050.1 hypothetical protein, conserved [Trypanosoma brucei brucei TREU927]
MENDVDEEVRLLLAVFPDEVKRDPGHAGTLIVSLPFRFELQITLPPHGYPSTSPPSLFVASGPNVTLISEYSSQLLRLVREEIPLGGPMLLHIVTLAQNLATELQVTREAQRQAKEEQQAKHKLEAAAKEEELQVTAVEVWSSDPITDRKSKFVAHMARVNSEAGVQEVVQHLRRQKHIAEATHPTIYAYRFTDTAGVLHADCNDDGETGAASRIMFLLEQKKVDGYVVVVTRWFGGILLGPDRFKHIMEVVHNILLTMP